MSAPADAGSPTVDPRIGPLLDLVQGLLQGYGELATTFAAYVPDPAARSRLMIQAQSFVEEGRRRYSDIAAPQTPPAGRPTFTG